MTAIMAFLTAKASGIAVGIAIPLVFGALYKFIPNKITSVLVGLFTKQNLALDKIEDPARKALYKALALDLVKIAEFEIPDKEKGAVKYKLVAEKLCSVIPMLKGQEDHIERLIEEAVAAMDAELKNQIPK